MAHRQINYFSQIFQNNYLQKDFLFFQILQKLFYLANLIIFLKSFTKIIFYLARCSCFPLGGLEDTEVTGRYTPVLFPLVLVFHACHYLNFIEILFFRKIIFNLFQEGVT